MVSWLPWEPGLQPARVSRQTTQSWLSQGDTDPPAPVSHWLEVAPEKWPASISGLPHMQTKEMRGWGQVVITSAAAPLPRRRSALPMCSGRQEVRPLSARPPSGVGLQGISWWQAGEVSLQSVWFPGAPKKSHNSLLHLFKHYATFFLTRIVLIL